MRVQAVNISSLRGSTSSSDNLYVSLISPNLQYSEINLICDKITDKIETHPVFNGASTHYVTIPCLMYQFIKKKTATKGLNREARGRSISNFVSSNMLGYCNTGSELYPVIVIRMEKQDRRNVNDLFLQRMTQGICC